uniref:ABC transporter related n=1 Tax=Methanococcus maripaludis (strain C6 / ATCC BAA-1332) TaxID=444158 RepID=A9A687_METM6
MALIETKNVIKTYGIDEAKSNVLKGINLKIEEGEFVMIMGPSGCGKSTLMNILGLLDVPSKGDVYIRGKKTTKMNENERAVFRRKISGFIFQQFHLIGTLTALGNVELPMTLDGKDEYSRKKRAKELLSIVGLTERESYKPSQLSGGQQQRVAIARSLSNNPKVLFADEPTGNLDSKSGKQVMEILENLHSEGMTVIMVTHDNYMIKYATKVIRMKDGEILEIDRVKDGEVLETEVIKKGA